MGDPRASQLPWASMLDGVLCVRQSFGFPMFIIMKFMKSDNVG